MMKKQQFANDPERSSLHHPWGRCTLSIILLTAANPQFCKRSKLKHTTGECLHPQDGLERESTQS